MAVHPDSVIDTRLQNLFPNAYTQLTDMEEYCYDNSQQTLQYSGGTPGVAEYQPFFQDLSDAIIAWHDFSWNNELIKNYIMALYQLIVFNELNGAGQSIINSGVGAEDTFEMNGYIDTLLGYAIEYYDDIEEVDEGGGMYSYNAPNLEADTTLVNNAPSNDEGNFDSIQSSIVSVSSSEVYNRLFDDSNNASALTKSDLYTIIFTDYQYETYFNELGLSNLVPSI